MPSRLRLRVRAHAGLGREADARADFEKFARLGTRSRSRGKFLAHLDLAEYADLLSAQGAADDAPRCGDVGGGATREARRA
ncbi:hypothetical protein [Amycolatopsis sp. NPDC057786]|uniref:hypothetical protein n=1 Tax=Amycolatopsis sp. NPDC057786 TaxID=3346250 RepID=UPI0036707B88